MNLAGKIYTSLANDPALFELVKGRVFNGLAPQNAQIPFVVFQLISETRESGYGGEHYRRARYQFSAWGETPESAQIIADAIDAVWAQSDLADAGKHVYAWHAETRQLDTRDEPVILHALQHDYFFNHI